MEPSPRALRGPSLVYLRQQLLCWQDPGVVLGERKHPLQIQGSAGWVVRKHVEFKEGKIK